MVHRKRQMKVLFVSSGKGGDVGYVVRNQGESLARQGIDIEYFTVTPGLAGYVKSIFRLKKNIRETKYDYAPWSTWWRRSGSFPDRNSTLPMT